MQKLLIMSFLAVIVTAGFLGVVAWALVYGIPSGESRDTLLLLIGSLSTHWGVIISYYFVGSVNGNGRQNHRKTDAIGT